MAQHLSGHLWNAAILAVSALVALAAERLSAVPARPVAVVSGDARELADISSFVVPLGGDASLPTFGPSLWIDPLTGRAAAGAESPVAPPGDSPTVPSAVTGGRLTAVLIADERRVAVIDNVAVSIGDVLRDGARVSAIQPDRVWVVEKNGKWRMLTLTDRGR